MNCTPKTVQSYTDALRPFVKFCDLQGIEELGDVDNFFVDAYFADMADRDHSDSGMPCYWKMSDCVWEINGDTIRESKPQHIILLWKMK